MATFDMPSSGTWERRGGWVVRQLVVDAGLTLEQAAGLVGNLGYESRGFATLQEIAPLVTGSAGGYGWAQWTGPRRRAFEKWSAEQGIGANTDRANYGFLLHELLGDYKSFTARLRRMASIEDACRLAHEQYERPQDVLDGSYRSEPDRLKWARRALEGAQGQPVAEAPPTLRRGSRGPAVADLQRKLAGLGYAVGPADGDFGLRTETAVQHFQADHGLKVDGVCGPLTWAALRK